VVKLFKFITYPYPVQYRVHVVHITVPVYVPGMLHVEDYSFIFFSRF
jgi:hypothetical protein